MLRALIESLSMLASDAAVQVAWLDEHGWPSDELAEDHSAPARNAWWMCEEGLISAEVRDLVERIDMIFTEMSGAQNAARWTYAALTTDDGWSQIRAAARRALGLLRS
ncbi:MAG TPA: hypothetical protein VFA06_24870 [Actinocrinis sp.]|uniref:hypothetical protein n=1 Tax=Actinocrinis sp. TaxID=1920516 RepID=UPI002D2C4213|nr:hypothetical protein [Actinocrinis sp.]HZU59137.1 hypothetical protein [Actinocrinis sp.]